MARSEVIQSSIWIMSACCALALWLIRNRALKAEVSIRKPHIVQICTQGSIYVYWCLNFDPVADQLWLIGAQLVLLYVLDLIFSWYKHGRWLLGFGPFPIIGSVNLFLWFKDDWWFLQLLMVLITVVSKYFLRWNRGGRMTHIFNPSAIALGALSLGVILADASDITWGQTIASGLNVPTYIFEWIFFTGVVVALFFSTTMVTLTAATSVWLVGLWYHQQTGQWFFHDNHIPIAVFLGMNLLITDPATSPRTRFGRSLFGLSYGLLVFPLWMVLDAYGQPTFYDKLLQVPLLNLMVPIIERISARVIPRLPRWSWSSNNLTHVALWCLIFAVMRPGLVDHPGAALTHGRMFASGDGTLKDIGKAAALFEKACTDGNLEGCNELARLLITGNGVTQDVKRGLRLYEEACEGGELHSCTSLGAMYFHGRLIPRDPIRAAQLYEQACKGDEFFGCVNLAMMYSNGDGIPKEVDKAVSLFERGCKAEHLGSCDGLAIMLYNGNGTTKNRTRALMLHRKACEGGEKAGCAHLAMALDQQADRDSIQTKIIALYQQACTGGILASCNELGRRYASADGVPKDMKKAAHYAEQACTGGYLLSCTNLGRMYYQGIGVEQDRKRGQKIIDDACRSGLQQACQMRSSMP